MEIIFDENKENTFQGKSCPVIELDTKRPVNFNEILKYSKELSAQYQNEKNIIIVPNEENEYMYLFAATMNIFGQNNEKAPQQAIIKVTDFSASLEKYKPYFSFTIAAIYALRLFSMDCKSMYRDIETLSYLGLNVSTDYIKNTITLHLPNNGKRYVLKGSNIENTIILACFIKMLSLLKVQLEIDVKIIIKKLSPDTVFPKDSDELLRKLFWCGKSFMGLN